MSHLSEWEKPAYCGIIEAKSDAYETQILKGWLTRTRDVTWIKQPWALLAYDVQSSFSWVVRQELG